MRKRTISSRIKKKKRDVSVEIEAIMNGEDKESGNIIKDVREMLEKTRAEP